MIVYDADLYDAEIQVERTGRACFDKVALASVLGISVKSVNKLKTRGKIPDPDHYEDIVVERGLNGGKRAIWTNAQVAQILAGRARD